MKTLATLALLLLAGIGANAFSGNTNFDRLKTLVGEWEAAGPEGTTHISIQLVSGGTALLENMGAASNNMVTMYHPDGDGVLMTHYCAAGNQPRMRVQKSDAGSITFQFVDAGNLKSRDDGHMQRLTIKFQDSDHVIEEWTWKEKGKERTSAFNMRRVK